VGSDGVAAVEQFNCPQLIQAKSKFAMARFRMNPLAPRPLLRAVGLVVLVAACLAYRRLGGSWLMFAALFFAPDLLMLGYLSGTRSGAWLYNLGHTYLTFGIIGFAAFLANAPQVLLVCVIWTAHIGFDRLLGYGLRYGTAFKDTHLARV
jgi:hypothetical protein